MQEDDLKAYVKGQVKSPEHLSDIIHRGFIEIEFDPMAEGQISDNLTESVEEKLKIMIDAIKELTAESVDVNLIGFDSVFKKLSKIGSEDVGKLVKIRGLVNAVGFIKPMFEEATYKCRRCGNVVNLPQEDPFKLIAPMRCNAKRAGSKNSCGCFKFDLDLEKSRYRDSQRLKIQELPEDVSGQIPVYKEMLVLKKSLMNRAKCGDYVNVIGIIKVRPSVSAQTTRFGETYIEVINIIIKRKEIDASELSKEDLEKVKELAKQPNIYNTLVFNVAPSLHGMDLEKEACLLAMVGGVKKELGDINRRDCIHVLMVGDPSMGKSQLLKAVSGLAPSGYYSSGKGTSTAGLTAAVIKEDNDWLVFAGVMVLADKGVACIDEIDKMRPEDREAMHEAMEQQTVSVNKANIHTTLMARTTVMSAANPILGRYDQYKTISDNIKNLPVTILSRFDIIFILIDSADEEKDRLLVKHVIGRNLETTKIDRMLIKNYIIYAKSFVPVMTEEAEKEIEEFYMASRRRQRPEDPIPITARQLESLFRISEAHAKLMLKDKVDAEDAKRAVAILSESLRQTCKFQTSEADINNIENPLTKDGKERLLLDILERHRILTEDKWKELAIEEKISEDEFKKMIMHLENFGKVKVKGFYPKTFAVISYRDDE